MEELYRLGMRLGGEKARWERDNEGGRRWGRHIWGVLEMFPPASDTLVDMGKERLLIAEGGPARPAAYTRLGLR